jgi:hypothetical protein
LVEPGPRSVFGANVQGQIKIRGSRMFSCLLLIGLLLELEWRPEGVNYKGVLILSSEFWF